MNSTTFGWYMNPMPNITLEECPICNSRNINKVFDVVDHFSSKELFPLFDCRTCGLRFTNNFPSENNIGKYYDSPHYISHSNTSEGLINKLYHHARHFMLKRKVRLVLRHIPKGSARLLDMGCGTGYFLHAAKEGGMIVSGIEKDQKAREYAINQFGLDVKDASHFWEIKNDSYNAITLWHALEHLEKLNESIDKIKDILTEDGALIIAVPNPLSFDASVYKVNWAAYDVPRHLWHFSPDTIERLLARHGMTIVKRHSMPFDAFYISLLSERYKRSNLLMQYSRAILIGSAGFIRSLFRLERASSIIYIAYKKKIVSTVE